MPGWTDGRAGVDKVYSAVMIVATGWQLLASQCQCCRPYSVRCVVCTSSRPVDVGKLLVTDRQFVQCSTIHRGTAFPGGCRRRRHSTWVRWETSWTSSVRHKPAPVDSSFCAHLQRIVTRLQPTAPFVPLTLCPRRKTKSKISSRILFRTGEVLQNEGNTTAVAFSAKSV